MIDQNEVVQLLESVDFNDEVDLKRRGIEKLPWNRLLTLGAGVGHILESLTGEGKSGLYYVDTAGKIMFNKKGSSAKIGSLMTEGGIVGGGQAKLYPVPFDPVILVVMASLYMIDKKADEIKAGQKEILEFLQLKERAKIEADLKDLSDILNNYKYNYDNEKYKTNKHIIVQNFKNESWQSMFIIREEIQNVLQKRKLIYDNKKIKKLLSEVSSLFEEYKKSLFLYGYSSFVETLLLENFNGDYLQSVKDYILEQSFVYRELYTDSYDVLEKFSKTSVESGLVIGVSKMSTLMGKAIEKMPVISDTQLDENLIKSGDKIKECSDKYVFDVMGNFINLKNPGVSVFADNIQVLKDLHDEKTQYFIDQDCMYVRMMA